MGGYLEMFVEFIYFQQNFLYCSGSFAIRKYLQTYYSDLSKNCIMDENYSILHNIIRSHHVAIVTMLPFDENQFHKLRSALHFRYSIVIEAGLGIPSLCFYFHTTFGKLLFLYIYRIYSCFAPLIAIDNINIVCEYILYIYIVYLFISYSKYTYW